MTTPSGPTTSPIFRAQRRSTPLVLRLAGYRIDPDTGDEGAEFELSYRCRPRIPADVLMAFTELMSTLDLRALSKLEDMAGGGDLTDEQLDQMTQAIRSSTASVQQTSDMLRAAILPGDYERFQQDIKDPELGIDMPTLTEAARWLSQQYSGERPTGRTSSNGLQVPQSGQTSTPGAQPEELTYSRPERTPSTPSGSST